MVHGEEEIVDEDNEQQVKEGIRSIARQASVRAQAGLARLRVVQRSNKDLSRIETYERIEDLWNQALIGCQKILEAYTTEMR